MKESGENQTGLDRIIKNIASVGLLQIANYVIPILIVPIVARTLGVEMVGKVSYAQNIISYFTLIVLYGFEYSATQEIAIHRDNQNRLSAIFSAVIIDRLLLLLISLGTMALLGLFWERMKNDMPLYYGVFLINVGFAFFPTWFFQGKEDMGIMSIFNFIIKLVGNVLVVLTISSPNDYLFFATIPPAVYAAVGFGAFLYVIIKYEIHFSLNCFSEAIYQMKKGFAIFVNTALTSVNTYANLTILGLYLSDYQMGIYSGAQRIIMAVLMMTSMPINIALFPTISRKIKESYTEGKQTFKLYAKYIVAIAACISLVSCIFAPLAVRILLGDGFVQSITPLKVLSALPLLVTTASLLTVQGVYGFGMQKYAPIIGLSLCIFSITMNLILIPRIGIYGAAFTWIGAEIVEILISGSILWLKVFNDK